MDAAGDEREQREQREAAPAGTGEAPQQLAGRPVLAVSTTKINRSAPFTVTVVVGSSWMRECGVTAECIWEAGRTAVLQRVDSEQELKPCAKCCVGKPNVVVSTWPSLSRSLSSASASDSLSFVFDNCKSYCNSSRLHFGGRVAIAMQIRAVDGSLAAVVRSEPVMLCARLRVRKSPPGGGLSSPEGDSEDMPSLETPGAAPEAAPEEMQQQQQQLGLQQREEAVPGAVQDEECRASVVGQLRELKGLYEAQLQSIRTLEWLLALSK
eukprot:m51a1_g9815 hypothetical protein (267) ;mRNA; f:1863978-1865323